MDTQLVYLKPNVVPQPLVQGWYAWSYLIMPATAAMYVANWHLRVMESFAAAPELHAKALEDPAMAGGPFVGHPAHRIGEIRELIAATRREQAPLLQMAEAIQALEGCLTASATGGSMQPLYAMVPEALKGFLELVYDVRSSPSVRWIEPLLYASPYYRRESQSLVFWEQRQDERAGSFSTPCLAEPGQLRLSIPFDDERVDQILQLKHTPRPLGRVRELLGARQGDTETADGLLTTRPPRIAAREPSPGLRVTYFGHACVLLEYGGRSILCDPLLSYEYPTTLFRQTYADLPERIDYALITHSHQDHFHLEALLQLRTRIGELVVPRSSGGSLQDPSLRLVLENTGFRNVREIGEFDTIPVDAGQVVALPFLGEHADLDIRAKVAYLVRLGGRQIVFAADTNVLEPQLYRHIHRLVGDIDVLFIGMECEGAPLSWAYGPVMQKSLPRKLEQSRRLNGADCERALALVDALRPRQVFVYAMGEEPWLTFIMGRAGAASIPSQNADQFVDQCRRRGVAAERLFGSHTVVLSSRPTGACSGAA